MRECLRCKTTMVEDLDVKVDGGLYGVRLTEKTIMGKTIEKPKVAICPHCGEVSIYIEDTNHLKRK